MSNCQNVNFLHTDKCLISLEFPTSLYEEATVIKITDDTEPLLLSCLPHTITTKWEMHVPK